MGETLNIPIRNKYNVVADKQTTIDIAKYMLIAEKDSRKHHSELKDFFDTGDPLETAQNIHQYARENLVYKRESPRKQIVRTAARVMNDIYVDCKGYSTFILASLQACGINSYYILAGYERGSKTPTHVYCAANIDGKEVIVDGTINSFGSEAPAVCKYKLLPLKSNDMALAYAQGVPDNLGRRTKSERKKKRKEKQGERKEDRQERRETRKQKVAKIAAAPMRGAFLAIIKINGFNLAKKLSQAIRKDRDRIQRFWAKFGGNWDDLVKEINKKSGEAAVGAIVMTTALAAATPILIAVGTLLKEMDLFSKEEEEDLELGISEGEDIISTDPEYQKSEMDLPKIDLPSGSSSKVVKVKKDYQEPSEDIDESEDTEESDNTILWLGAAAVAVIMLTKNN